MAAPRGDPQSYTSWKFDYGYSLAVTNKSRGYGHLPPRFVPHVARAEWAWIPTSRAAATDALVVC